MLGVLEYRADPTHERSRTESPRLVAERPHLAASRPKKPRKEHREGRLPASVGPGDREGAAAPNGCRHPVERRSLAAWIMIGEIPGEDRHAVGCRTCRRPGRY